MHAGPEAHREAASDHDATTIVARGLVMVHGVDAGRGAPEGNIHQYEQNTDTPRTCTCTFQRVFYPEFARLLHLPCFLWDTSTVQVLDIFSKRNTATALCVHIQVLYSVGAFMVSKLENSGKNKIQKKKGARKQLQFIIP